MFLEHVQTKFDNKSVFFLGVHINITDGSEYIVVGEEVEFKVTLFPRNVSVMYYEWNFGEDAKIKVWHKDTRRHSYRRYGK